MLRRRSIYLVLLLAASKREIIYYSKQRFRELNKASNR